jgi:hypothetical protein
MPVSTWMTRKRCLQNNMNITVICHRSGGGHHIIQKALATLRPRKHLVRQPVNNSCCMHRFAWNFARALLQWIWLQLFNDVTKRYGAILTKPCNLATTQIYCSLLPNLLFTGPWQRICVVAKLRGLCKYGPRSAKCSLSELQRVYRACVKIVDTWGFAVNLIFELNEPSLFRLVIILVTPLPCSHNIIV